MIEILISSFEPRIVSFDLIAHGQLLRVQVQKHLLSSALRIHESSVDLGTVIEQHVEAIRDIAWAQHERTRAQTIVLSADELKPLSAWVDRTGPPVVEQVPQAESADPRSDQQMR